MTSPYDIDEIFPEESAGSVRLPRRQAGNSPQGLAVTLLADYTLRTRAWLPAAAIVDLLAEGGVSPAGARTAISRLVRRGVLEGRRQGRRGSHRLTAAAAASLTIGGSAIAAAAAPPWDEQWTLVAFSLPQQEGTLRRALRGKLRWMGFAPLYDGLWISPHDLSEKTRARFAELTLGTLTVFRARHIELDAAIRRNPLDAWDTAEIARQYEAFIRRWSRTPSEISGAGAVRARTEVMDTYRRLPILDPQLPIGLLPPGWLREPARELFMSVYDGLADAAQEHVRAVASPYSGDEVSGVRAHTVAELAAGLGR
ncbi:PaaX family transcriptional regulator C-terminal domain-containing protein [Amorphoplanes digitatis]|uniref:PaaX family transcriptional regulator n=1 Tax=Actinoplanes digitatis TaxID=1868 RepID=UPI00161A97DA|nr:PaaX family transcriptional regulator C-terminal domain-containing protein [Actinoplanes digitatis]